MGQDIDSYYIWSFHKWGANTNKFNSEKIETEECHKYTSTTYTQKQLHIGALMKMRWTTTIIYVYLNLHASEKSHERDILLRKEHERR